MNFFKDHLNLSNNIYDNAQILKAAEIKKQQEVVDRNPTTKYYQTLAQNLQEQVNNLKKYMLSEAGVVPPSPGITPPPNPIPGYNPVTPPFPGIAPAPTTPTAPTAPGGPPYVWPTPPPLGKGTGEPKEKEYFPDGLGPTTGPDKAKYPKTKEGVLAYQRDQAAWERARAAYYYRLTNQNPPNERPQTPRPGGGYYPAGN